MGHGTGDELLAAVAGRLAASVRPSDTAARLGGDEFALLIDDAPDAETVEVFAERIVAAFTGPFTLSDAEVIATATVGVATSVDSTDADELLRHADLALYAAKAAGKRRWRQLPAGAVGGHAPAARGAGRARGRAQELRVHARLPADRDARQRRRSTASRRWSAGRTRSWGMMLPGQFITLAEETGPHRAARRLGAAAGPGRHGPVAPPDGGAAGRRPARLGQRLRPAVPRPGLRRRRPAGAARVRAAAVGAAARAHRVRPARRQRPDRGRARGAEGHRRAAGDRRLRHRLLLAQLPASSCRSTS